MNKFQEILRFGEALEADRVANLSIEELKFVERALWFNQVANVNEKNLKRKKIPDSFPS